MTSEPFSSVKSQQTCFLSRAFGSSKSSSKRDSLILGQVQMWCDVILVIIVLMLSFSCSSHQMRSPAHPSKLPCPLTGTSSAEQGSATDLGLYLGWDDSFFTFTFLAFNNQKCAAIWPYGFNRIVTKVLGKFSQPFWLVQHCTKGSNHCHFPSKE